MVPDIEWGKNIRVVLDIGCTDSSFVASLFDKDVLTLSLGLKNDLVDLAQVALERGFPTLVSPFGSRRLPFPSGVFDAIHCGGCTVTWHSSGLCVLPSCLPVHVFISSMFPTNFRHLFIYFIFSLLHILFFVGGRHLLEMNRILRPGGYFVLSTKHDNIEDEEGSFSLYVL